MPVILVSGNLKSNKGFEFVEKPSLPATLMIVVRRVFPSTVGKSCPIDRPPCKVRLDYRTRFRVERPSFVRRCKNQLRYRSAI